MTLVAGVDSSTQSCKIVVRDAATGVLVREGATRLGGAGGGKDDLAQGGGSDAARADEALQAVEYAIGHVLLG